MTHKDSSNKALNTYFIRKLNYKYLLKCDVPCRFFTLSMKCSFNSIWLVKIVRVPKRRICFKLQKKLEEMTRPLERTRRKIKINMSNRQQHTTRRAAAPVPADSNVNWALV